jgi:hypothetical protein
MQGVSIMSDLNFVPRKPDFSGDGYSVWVSVDKTGKSYLRLKDKRNPSVTFTLFKLEDKKVQVVEETAKM